MAAPSYTPIQLYYSTTANNVPLAANLTNGELAINTNDGILYYKNSSGAVTKLATKYFVDQNGGAVWLTSVSGTNTIVGTVTPAPTAYVAGQSFRFIAAANNTGAVTLNVSGLGAVAITKNGSTALAADDIVSGSVVSVTYDGTEFQLSSGIGASGAQANGVIQVNKTQINNNYTFPTGSNGMSVGPVRIASGQSVTVSSGSRWVVL